MNAFTAKPKPPAWLKELDRNHKTSKIMQEIINNPTPTQVRELKLYAKRLHPTSSGKP